jgi:hypothetical protein
MNASVYATVVSGLALVALGSGFAAPPRIWWGLGLTLLAILLGRVLIQPAVGKIVSARSCALPLSEQEASRLARDFAFGVHAEGVVRIAVLWTMEVDLMVGRKMVSSCRCAGEPPGIHADFLLINKQEVHHASYIRNGIPRCSIGHHRSRYDLRWAHGQSDRDGG